MRRIHRTLIALLLLAATPALADDAEGGDAFAFDGVNAPLQSLLERAKAEKKLVFLDFYLPG